MRSTYAELNCSLDDLKSFVDSINPVNKALESHGDGLVRRYLSIRKRLDNAAFIVALYAALERFIEDLLWSFVELESGIKQYSELPEKLRNKNIQISGELLAKGRLGVGRYIGTTSEDLISNLFGCLSGNNNYKINRHAVVRHEQNCRAGVIQDMFLDIGVEAINSAIRRHPLMVRWHCEAQGLEFSVDEEVPLIAIETRLEDLVERRNRITHRGADSDGSLAASELPERLDFIRSYCSSLYSILVSKHLNSRYNIVTTIAVDVGDFIEGPIRDNIVVIAKPSCRTYVGQAVIGISGGKVDRWGSVVEIRINDNPVDSVAVIDDVDEIGIKFDFKISRNTRLLLLPERDPVAWD